ncbi:unnamed protein product [Trichobilharzia regenti]|nr:unnamed protein product [Trichobilharzia regenti]
MGRFNAGIDSKQITALALFPHQIVVYSDGTAPPTILRGTSPTDRLQVARQTRSCFVRLQEVHKKANCEEVSVFSGKINVKSASSGSDYELCVDIRSVKTPVVATGKPLLNRVSQRTPQFVQKKGVTVSESSSDFTSFQGITSQSKEFDNDEVSHIKGGKVDICDNDHGSALLSLADHGEMKGMSTTAELNKSSVQLDRELDLMADTVAEGMVTHEIISVNDQRVAHLSIDLYTPRLY